MKQYAAMEDPVLKKPKLTANVSGSVSVAESSSLEENTGISGIVGTSSNIDAETRATGFHKELASVMYGFGDLWNPLPETIDLMNKIVNEYIEDMTRESMNSALKGKLTYHCLLFALRHQQQKVDRINQLIKINKELKERRRQGLKEEAKWFKTNPRHSHVHLHSQHSSLSKAKPPRASTGNRTKRKTPASRRKPKPKQTST